MKAVIFNSGTGSRLGNLTKDSHKCMLKLYNGETILERQLRILSECGIKEVVITTGAHKEQIINAASQYKNLNIEFADNQDYMNTNYIVSMYNARELMDDNILLMHGDLVFNKCLIEKLLADDRKDICLFKKTKELPVKDFKGRFEENILKEVSVNIFGDDCMAFQPLYKLSRHSIGLWLSKVVELVEAGKTKVYAEEALNEVTGNLNIVGMSYEDDYINEIDDADDYKNVNKDICIFEYDKQRIIDNGSYKTALKELLNDGEKIFAVCTKSKKQEFLQAVNDYNVSVFCAFSPNPDIKEIEAGIEEFSKEEYTTVISFGGGSCIDVAKCIVRNRNVRHIAIPTTAGTGSESTDIAVMYDNGVKKSIEDMSILPQVAVLDAQLLETLPDYQKKVTLLDALCQGIESYWAKNATKESRIYAKACIELILDNYSLYLQGDREAAKKINLAANYSGRAICISRTTSAHAMSYKLTSSYGVSHGYAVALCIVPIWQLLHKKAENDKSLYNTLMELSEMADVDTVRNMLSDFGLDKPEIAQEDIRMLAESVDRGRLSNNPAEFSLEELKDIYRTI